MPAWPSRQWRSGFSVSKGPNEHPLLRDSLPISRWLLPVVLLVAEYVVALFLFDSERMPITQDTGAFAFIGESMSLIIVMMTATVLVGGGLSKRGDDRDRRSVP